MTIISKAAVAAGVFGTIFFGYCIYFDRKRRNDPDFKKKLRERRKLYSKEPKYTPKTSIPDLKDHDAVQKFFLQEVQLGEECLGRGELDVGIEHLCNAVAVCGQPNQLLQILQQTLPPQVFQLLVTRFPAVVKRFEKSKDSSELSAEVE